MATKFHNPIRHTTFLGTAVIALAGCSLVPDYHRPAPAMPQAFQAPKPVSASPLIAANMWPSADWWRGFNDPELDRLEELARVHNDDILVAIATVRAADAQARQAGTALLPSLSLGGQQEWSRSNQSTRLASAGIGSSIGASSGSSASDTRSYSLTGTLSYELDFWGSNRANAKASNYTALASRYSQANVALTVETSVATAYFAAIADAEELEVARKNLDSAQRTLAVYQGREEAGTATALDVAQQQANVASQQATIPADQSTLAQEVTALGILVGQPPEAIAVTLGRFEKLSLPVVTAGLPSELLERRPDVADAEAQLMAENQQIGVSRAAFFPSFSLTGTDGFQSQALNKLLIPGAVSTSLATSFTQPLFDAGKLRDELAATRAQYDELAGTYHKAVLQALTDVEDALIGVHYITEQVRLQQVYYDTSNRANDIALEQMKAGTVDITTVLNTENTLRSAQLSLVQAQLSQVNSLVTLFKALGGGFSSSEIAAMKG